MNWKGYTRDEVIGFGLCEYYTPEVVDALFDDAETLTILDALRREDIPAGDRVWLATRPGVLPAEIMDTWLMGIVERAVTNHALHCGVDKVELWAQRWLSGEDRSEAAADAAVWAEATRAAARAAAAAATRADARAAAATAATAARAAAHAAFPAAVATRAAARAAEGRAAAVAIAAEYTQQVTDLLAIIKAAEGVTA